MEKPGDSFKSMVAEMNLMRKAGELTDVTLIFEGKKIPCHKRVLASKSEYFKAMLISGLRESSSQEVQMHGIDAETGSVLVDYFYEDDLKMTEKNAADLYVAASERHSTDCESFSK
jgi:hypothetical protein